ncbi:MAG: hypothetical protein H6563_04625 [Lewinellaceae bacterium]|nr:hypothetical protein [Lewinellaceae bacterium]
MKPIYLFLIALLAGLAGACRSGDTTPRPAVYHWESDFSLTPEERQWLDEQHIQRIYLRLFDIDWDEGLQAAVPVGVLQAPDTVPRITRQIVPTFFITNRTFEHLSEVETDSLALRLVRKAQTKLRDQLGAPTAPEWQFDCDWTEGTRDRYFQFLETVNSVLKPGGATLSATIRLHQVKYHQRTGVPPVDRGMLMFYNMGTVDDPGTTNSILDLQTAGDYYYNFDSYPLPLDLALPIFRWGVVFRDGKMVRLINNLSDPGLSDTSRFVFRDGTHVEVRKSTYLDGYYLYAGDLIRLEWVAAGQLQSAARDLRRMLNRPPEWVSFYYLAPETIKYYSHEELETVFHLLAH